MLNRETINHPAVAVAIIVCATMIVLYMLYLLASALPYIIIPIVVVLLLQTHLPRVLSKLRRGVRKAWRRITTQGMTLKRERQSR